MLQVTQFVQNSPKAKLIRGDLNVTVIEVSGTNIYDAVLRIKFESNAAGLNQNGVITAQVAAMCYLNLLTDSQIEQTAFGHIVKKMYQATSFKQMKELEGQRFTNIGMVH